jgi:hypothetical protein
MCDPPVLRLTEEAVMSSIAESGRGVEVLGMRRTLLLQGLVFNVAEATRR